MRSSTLFWVVAIFLLVHVASGAVYDVTFTPIMTNNTQPSGYIASASSEEYTRDAYNAFDRVNEDPEGTAWSTWQTGITTGWIQLQIPVGKVARNYTIWDKRWGSQQYLAAAQAPKVFNLSGSTNGVDWTTLDSRTNVTWNTTIWEGKSFEFENFVPYTYYRLNVLENNGNPSTLQIGEIYLYESKSVVAAFNVSPIEGNATLWVDFTDLSVGEPTAWSWQKKEFNESTWTQFNNTQNPRNGFVEGNWSIRLNVSNSESWNISTQETWISVSPSPLIPGAPKYWFDSDRTRGAIPLRVNFESLAPNASGWTWFFGDEEYMSPWEDRTNHIRYKGEGPSVVLPNGHILWTIFDDGPYVNKTLISTDGGLHWTIQSNPSSWQKIEYGPSLVALPNGHALLMGGIEWDYGDESSRVYRTVDEGITWEEMTPPFTPGYGYMPCNCSDYPQHCCGGAEWMPREIFGATALSDGSVIIGGGYQRELGDDLGDVWRSTDEGATWTQVSTPMVYSWSGNSIVGQIGGGAEWAMFNDTCWGRESHDFVTLSNDTILLVGGNGCDYDDDVWASYDKGAHWTMLTANAGFGGLSDSCVSVSPDDTVTIGYNGGYNRAVWKSEDSGITWTQQTSQGQAPAISYCYGPGYLPDGKLVMVGGYERGNTKYASWVSENDGASWYELNTSQSLSGRWSPSIASFPDGSIIIAGGYGFPDPRWKTDTWMSTDLGTHWNLMNSTFPDSPEWGSLVAIGNSTLVMMDGYAPQTDDVFRSTDKGITWTLVNSSPGWSEDYGWQDASAVVTLDGDILHFGGWGYNSNTYNLVWRSQDQGSTWTKIKEHNESDWQTRAGGGATVLPNGHIIYAGGEGQISGNLNDVWMSADEGVSWTRQNASAGWAPRMYPGLVALSNGKLILSSGELSGVGNDPSNDTWESINEGITWAQLPNAPWAATRGNRFTVLPGDIIVATGGDRDVVPYQTNDTWVSTDEGRTWVQTYGNPSKWSPRTGASAVATNDGSAVILGGYSDAYGRSNDVWRSINNGETWSQMKPHNASQWWDRRDYSCAVTLSDDSIVLMGGLGQTLGVTNDTWISYDYGKTWTKQNSSSGWAKRQTLSCAALSDDTIIIAGGAGSGLTPSYGDVWISVDRGLTWSLQTDNPGWTSRSEAQLVPLSDDSLILVGGYHKETYEYLNDTWKSTNHGVTWTQLTSSAGWPKRQYFNAVSQPDDSILLMNGYSKSDYKQMNDTWRSPDGGITWVEISQPMIKDQYGYPISGGSGWPARQEASTIALSDGSVITMGGWNTVSNSFNSVWRFDPSSSHLENPTHIYTEDGTYDVTLQAINSTTTKSVIKKDYIKSADGIFTANETMGLSPLDVKFTDLCQSNNSKFVWFFGDELYNQSWILQNTSAGWTDRSGLAGVSLPDNSIVISGGWDGTRQDDVWRSIDEGLTWTLQNGTPGWDGRNAHVMVSYPNGNITLAGGYKSSGSLRDVWRSTTNGSTWTLMTANPGWSNRMGMGSVVLTNNDTLIMGGTTEYYNDYKREVWKSSNEGLSWTQLSTPSWNARSNPAVTLLSDGSILLMGGANNTVQMNDTWISTDSGVTWVLQNISSGWTPRIAAVTRELSDGSVIIMGGTGKIDYTWTDTNSVWRTTDKGVTWYRLPNAGWAARSYSSLVTLQDGTSILSGGSMTNEVWRFTPAGSYEQNPAHTYTGNTSDTFNVSFESNCNPIVTKFNYITIGVEGENPNGALVPIAQWVINRLTVRVPGSVVVTDQSTNDPTSWEWSWGDGTPNSTFQDGGHTYYKRGNFPVILKVSNSAGSDISDPQVVRAVGY